MATTKLTDALIRNLEPDPKGRQQEHFDSVVRGLAVRVSQGGAKAFVQLYRFQQRSRRYTLGRYPDITLAEARKRARRVKLEVSQGLDPVVEKYRLTRRPEATFDDVLRAYIERYARIHTKSWEDTKQRLERHFLPRWKHRDVKTIRRNDVQAVLDGLFAKGQHAAANKLLALIRKLFNWAVETEFLEDNPCAGIKSVSLPERERVLDDRELSAIWRAAAETSYPFGPIVQLVALTMQRRGEVASMEWSQLDLQKATWTLPSSHTKAKRLTVVPLSAKAIEIITALPQLHDKLVFPALGKDTCVSGFSKWKRDLELLVGSDDWDQPWTLHDLRRTAATWLAANDVPLHVIERLLNHADGGQSKVAKTYNRHQYFEERKRALNAWTQHIEQCAV